MGVACTPRGEGDCWKVKRTRTGLSPGAYRDNQAVDTLKVPDD